MVVSYLISGAVGTVAGIIINHIAEGKEGNADRERLAKLEHQQWMYWTKWLVKEYDDDIPPDLERKWRQKWRPYEELSEEDKDKDRKWADKVLEVIE